MPSFPAAHGRNILRESPKENGAGISSGAVIRGSKPRLVEITAE
jgi:hypothetical protein